jgi:glycosyltransferase involved in cell wall biosynthesis
MRAGGCCTLSVVVQTRSEAPNVAVLVSRLRAALGPVGLDWELVFVDDSNDATPDAIRQAMFDDPAVRPCAPCSWGALRPADRCGG